MEKKINLPIDLGTEEGRRVADGLCDRVDRILDGSFEDFCRDVLGFTDMNQYHKKLCKFMTSKKKFKLVLMPRYTFKSCICTVGYSLKRLLYNPDLRVLIYSDAATKATRYLADIKNHILGKIAKSNLRDYLGEWETDPKTGKWNETDIIISRRRTAHPEPSVKTAGIETSLVGSHYDIIIFDDIVSDKNVTTKEQMDKVAECYSKALSLLRPGGEVILVGTRWHFGDLYGKIIAENEESNIFDTFIMGCEEDGKLLFDDIGENSLTREFLDLQRNQQGSYIFSCLYNNSPVDDLTAVFKKADFSFYGAIKNDDLYMTCTCDPAGEGEDFTAITVVGTDNKMDMHILEIVNAHLQPSDIVDKLIALSYKYKYKMLGLEKNFFRGMLRMELERRIAQEKEENESFRLFGVREFQPSARKGEGKDNRIRALQPYHERGALKFPGEKVELLKGDFSKLAYQMLQFPRGKHDDILDSLAYHLELIRKGGIVRKASHPKYSAAWLEERSIEKEVALHRYIPKRFRKAITDPVFA